MAQDDRHGSIWIYDQSPFDNAYQNTIHATTQAQLDNFFATSSKLNLIYNNDTHMWNKKTGVVSVNTLDSVIENATYMRFQNEEGKMIYAFIMATKYSSRGEGKEGVTNIAYEIDVWNTYQVEFWQEKFGGYVEQLTMPNYTTNKDDNLVRNIVEIAQGFNTGERKIVNAATAGLDIDWLIFVMLPTVKINSADNRNGSAGFPGAYKAFRYFVVPANISSGNTIDYSYDGTLVKSTSIANVMASFTNIFADDGSTNTVNQCVNCYTTKHCGFKYSYDYDVVEIDSTNLVGNILGPLTAGSVDDSGSGSSSESGIAGGWLDGSVNYTGGALTYSGNTLSSAMISSIIIWCRQYKLWPEGIIAQMYYESNWGTSPVAISDNNWSGITWNSGWSDPRTISDINITITRGSARPSAEGGYYTRFNSATDWLAYHMWILRPGNLYVSSEKTSVEGFGQGLFRAYGASADYAATAADTYVATLVSIANSIRTANTNATIDAINTLAYDPTKNDSTISANVQSLLTMAASQIGYLEKASNSQLDDFTANAGSGNFTKYARDLANNNICYAANPNPWCAYFVSWCGWQIGMTSPAYYFSGSCSELISKYQGAGRWYSTPQPGDIALKSSHTGIVETVNGNSIVCIEGNSSDRCQRVTSTVSSWSGFGRPNWTNSSTGDVNLWSTNDPVDQLAGLSYLNSSLGLVQGDGTSMAVCAMYSGMMTGPNMGAGTIYTPMELADGFTERPFERDAWLGYDWSTYNWDVIEGPVALDDVPIGSIMCIKPDGTMTMPFSTDTEDAYNKRFGYAFVVKSKNSSTGRVTGYCNNSVRGVFEYTFVWDADSISGGVGLPDTYVYNDSEYTENDTNNTPSGSYDTIITDPACLEVIRMTNLSVEYRELPDILWLIDQAYNEILGTNWESQLLSGEFVAATLYDIYGNAYNFDPEKLPEATDGEYQQDGPNNETTTYLPGNHLLEITGSLGDSNHVHYTINDYNIYSAFDTKLEFTIDQNTGYSKRKFAHGIHDSTSRGVTVLSDQTATFMQSQKNQYDAQMASFSENADMIEMQNALNTANTQLTTEQATYNANYALENANISRVTDAVGAGLGVVGGVLSGNAFGVVSGVTSGLTGFALNSRNIGNQEQQSIFTEQSNQLLNQSNALTNMQNKLALNQSIRAYNASIKDLGNRPASIANLGNDVAFQAGNNSDDLYLKIEIPNEDILLNANNYIKGYGVIYNGWLDDLRGVLEHRQKFNYLKMIDLEMPNIKMPQAHYNTLKSIFISGTRIWELTDTFDSEFGDITINNPDV